MLAYLRSKALYLLARREHSRFELFTKLKKYNADEQEINALLDELTSKNLLSDLRFVESYSRMRIQAGRGQLLILKELETRGINQTTAKDILKSLNINWLQILHKAWERKFDNLPQDYQEYAKQMRFLLSRGFSYSEINQLIKNNLDY